MEIDARDIEKQLDLEMKRSAAHVRLLQDAHCLQVVQELRGG